MLWFIVALFTDLFQCRPFQAAFDPELLFTDQCINLQAYYWGVTASNLCLDVVMLYMPLHMVWGLKLPTRQKIALSGVFLLGGMWATSLFPTRDSVLTNRLQCLRSRCYAYCHNRNLAERGLDL